MTPEKSHPCPVCKCSNADTKNTISHHGDYARIFCTACSCAYIWPLPPQPTLYDTKYNENFFRPGDIRKAGIMAEFITLNLPNPDMPAKILEIGAGNGLTVFLLRQMGHYAEGLEIDTIWGEKIAKRLGIPIICQRFEDISTARRWELIYSSHTLEHSIEPQVFVNKCAECVTKQGIIIIDTPNANDSKTLGEAWHHFQTRNPLEHICVLSPQGMGILAHSAGLCVTHIIKRPEFQSFTAILKKK